MTILSGTELRYVLTFHLANQGPATVAELIEGLRRHGFWVAGATVESRVRRAALGDGPRARASDG